MGIRKAAVLRSCAHAGVVGLGECYQENQKAEVHEYDSCYQHERGSVFSVFSHWIALFILRSRNREAGSTLEHSRADNPAILCNQTPPAAMKISTAAFPKCHAVAMTKKVRKIRKAVVISPF